MADPTRMIVSGGLRPDNVAQAVAHLRPAGVDVASGVEVSPGRKDPLLVREFIVNARAAETEADARDPLDDWEAVHGLGGQVDVDRLGELAHDGAVLAVDEADAEAAPLRDEVVGEGLVFDADANPFRVEGELCHPVRCHQLFDAWIFTPGPNDVEP